MPSLIDIRRRIRAVKSTQQITKAMKMIAASKLRRAQERIVSARPFAREMQRVLGGLVARVDSSMHPLLAEHDAATATGRTLLLVVTADKGLCGGFNTNIIKAASVAIRDAGGPVALGLIGRKGRDFFGRRGVEVVHEDVGLFSAVKYTHAQAIAAMAIDQFTSNRVDRVVVVYNEFKSVMQQRINVEQLLPIPRAEVAATEPTAEAAVDYLYEPPPHQIFETLLPRHVEIQIYRVLLESAAAEHAARMTAMEAATKNSTEMIDTLTLYMNKVRQAAITREIIEVVSGAQAL
jgi:F-type H+-transporting ATPase subunit gamma